MVRTQLLATRSQRVDWVSPHPVWRQNREEAQTVFYDDEAIMIDDPEHSKEERRFILLGMSSLLRVLLVSHCARDEGDTIRIISARRANRHEQRQYRERYGQ
jgi:uncharacterized protein